MIASTRQPVIPKPPDDPTFWLLNRAVGWRIASPDLVQDLSMGDTLMLSLDTTAGRRLDETSGSFGGLVLPTNMAFAPDGAVFLLDTATGHVRRFDGCVCAFVRVPCLGGQEPPREYGPCEELEGYEPRLADAGLDPRRVREAHGLGISNGALFVCDTGGHRLLQFSLHGFVLRAMPSPPPPRTPSPWTPYAIAFDRHGRWLVTDPANGAVHRFSRWGTYESGLSGLDTPTHLAVDCRDRLFVATADGVLVFDANWQPLDTPSHPQDVADQFPPLPLLVDTAGNLDLRLFCAESSDASGIFDAGGAPLAATAWIDSSLAYMDKGHYISEPLDSSIYRCQWHRLIIDGAIPSGTRVRALTYTSETPLTVEEMAQLADDAWTALPVASAHTDGSWEALIRSEPGRYLILRLQLEGDGAATPSLESICVEYPRISLRRYLPAVFGEDPVTADFTDRFLAIFDTTLRGIERHLDFLPHLFDPLSTPAEPLVKGTPDFLSWLASWIDVTLDRRLSIDQRRTLLKQAGSHFARRGTKPVLHEQLMTWLGFDTAPVCCRDPRRAETCSPLPPNCSPAVPTAPRRCPPLILEHYQLRRWLEVGHGRLGDQAVLWGASIVNRSQLGANARVGATKIDTTTDPRRDPFHVYAHRFSVFVPACYRDDVAQRKSLEQLIETEKPAATRAQLVFVKPSFRVGVQSCIGFDSVVGRYPDEMRLPAARLGYDTIVAEPPYARGGPSLAVGTHSRVGTSTRLN